MREEGIVRVMAIDPDEGGGLAKVAHADAGCHRYTAGPGRAVSNSRLR